jgi:hypothetical protein
VNYTSGAGEKRFLSFVVLLEIPLGTTVKQILTLSFDLFTDPSSNKYANDCRVQRIYSFLKDTKRGGIVGGG